MGDQRLLAPLAAWCLDQAGLQPVLAAPPSVETAIRQDLDNTYLFLLNHAGASRVVTLPQAGIDLVTGECMEGEIALAPRQVVILARERGSSTGDT